MATKHAGGRASIFEGKAGGDRVQGDITKRGAQQFEAARRRLTKLAEWKRPNPVSDADVIEFLARGEAETLRYLARVHGLKIYKT
jgi:hypothetical protein